MKHISGIQQIPRPSGLSKMITLAVLLAALLMAACTPAATPTPAPVETEQRPPAAVTEAQQQLAAELGVSPDEINIREIEEMQWTDSCLGTGGPAESCLQVLTPGYRAILEYQGETFEFHTNLDGSNIRLYQPGGEESPAPVETPQADATEAPLVEKNLPKAVLNAREVLAQQIQMDLEDIQVVSFEAVEWPDGCLGVHKRGMMCIQVITPGYRVVFEAGGEQYEFHTDAEGGSVVQAAAPLPRSLEEAVVWEQTEGGVCSRVVIGARSASFGSCDGEMVEALLEDERAGELSELLSRYAPFTAGTKAGTVTFKGRGSQEPSEAEQRSIAEWARLVYQESSSGRRPDSLGMVFEWHQEGGIAGFCSDLTLYRTGWYSAASCRGEQPQDLGSARLDGDELAQVYEWVDRYESFEYEFTDAAAADAMTTRLVFSGEGEQAASQAEQEAIARFAEDLFRDVSG